MPFAEKQRRKFVSVTPPGAIVDNAAFTTATIDTKGYDYATIVVYLGDTDIAMTELKVQESDDSGMSGAADVTGLVWGTSTNIDGSTSALPSANDDNKFQVAQIDLRGRKRYLDVSATAGNGTNGTYATILAILESGEVGPTSISECGCDEILRV